jgi:hypothetical protein
VTPVGWGGCGGADKAQQHDATPDEQGQRHKF